jgi:hypothetical protein
MRLPTRRDSDSEHPDHVWADSDSDSDSAFKLNVRWNGGNLNGNASLWLGLRLEVDDGFIHPSQEKDHRDGSPRQRPRWRAEQRLQMRLRAWLELGNVMTGEPEGERGESGRLGRLKISTGITPSSVQVAQVAVVVTVGVDGGHWRHWLCQ